MTKLAAFLQAHAKAITAFVTAEASTLIVALQADQTTIKDVVIALLLPFAVGGATHQIPNKAS